MATKKQVHTTYIKNKTKKALVFPHTKCQPSLVTDVQGLRFCVHKYIHGYMVQYITFNNRAAVGVYTCVLYGPKLQHTYICAFANVQNPSPYYIIHREFPPRGAHNFHQGGSLYGKRSSFLDSCQKRGWPFNLCMSIAFLILHIRNYCVTISRDGSIESRMIIFFLIITISILYTLKFRVSIALRAHIYHKTNNIPDYNFEMSLRIPCAHILNLLYICSIPNNTCKRNVYWLNINKCPISAHQLTHVQNVSPAPQYT